MSGIYILKTKDGYRVNFAKNYDYLFSGFNDDTMDYNIDTQSFKEVFGNCAVIPNEFMANASAQAISKVRMETDDGIVMLSYSNFTFEELLNGKANKTS